MPFFSGRCLSTVKVALVTGCHTGILKETVLHYYERGAKVIMACWSMERAEELKTDIEKLCKDLPDTGNIVLAKCDLTSLKSVREFAQSILDTEPQINILVNNAGVMICPKSETDDGSEMQLGTDHLGLFLLTMLLLPRIRNSTPARIVTISSRTHIRYGSNNTDGYYKVAEAHWQSMLANVLFSRELAAKLKEHNIQGINTYPSMVKTELVRHLIETLFWGARKIIGFVMAPFMKSPESGARTTIYIDENYADETGLYYSVFLAKDANDENAKKLWGMSVELVKLGDYDPFTANDPGVKTV